MTQRPQVDISITSVFRAFLPVLALVLIYLLSDVLIILLFAIVIASAVNPFVAWFEKRKVPRIVGVLLLYVMVMALVILLSSLVIPPVVQDLSQLTSSIPQLTQDLTTSLDSVQQNTGRYLDVVSELQNILEFVAGYLQQFSRSALGLAVSAFGGVLSFVAIVVISFYLAVMKKGIESFLEAVLPERYESYVIDLWKRAEAKMGLWLQGQLMLALVVGILVYIGLAVLGVRFALLLAIVAMLLEVVPMAGPVLAAIPAIGMAFFSGPETVVWVILLYIGIQQLEGNILFPLIMGKQTGLNPIVVILAIFIGGNLAGIPGAILAIPVATVLVEVLDDVARAKTSRRTS
jgi:predicted PurR-regulated permease PerM